MKFSEGAVITLQFNPITMILHFMLNDHED